MSTKLRIVHDWKTQRREAQERIGRELYISRTQEANYDASLGPKFFKMMEDGATLEECAARHRVSLRTISQWCNPSSPAYHEDFSNWVIEGSTACYAWWVSKAKENLENRKFNDKMWEKIMKHVFGWVDRSELSGPNGQPLLGDTSLSSQETAARIRSILALAEQRRIESTAADLGI